MPGGVSEERERREQAENRRVEKRAEPKLVQIPRPRLVGVLVGGLVGSLAEVAEDCPAHPRGVCSGMLAHGR